MMASAEYTVACHYGVDRLEPVVVAERRLGGNGLSGSPVA